MHPFKTLKRILPRSLLGRMLLILIMPLILVQLVSTWVFYDRHWDTISKRLANAVAGDIALLIRVLEADPHRREAILSWVAQATDVSATIEDGARLRP